jgi:hypothetical protein
MWGVSTIKYYKNTIILRPIMGFDHGVGHSFLILCPAKAPNYRKNKALNELANYSKWPKVADAVIEADQGTPLPAAWARITSSPFSVLKALSRRLLLRRRVPHYPPC